MNPPLIIGRRPHVAGGMASCTRKRTPAFGGKTLRRMELKRIEHRLLNARALTQPLHDDHGYLGATGT